MSSVSFLGFCFVLFVFYLPVCVLQSKVCVCVCVCVCIVCVCVCVCVCARACTRMCAIYAMHVRMALFVCVCVCVRARMYTRAHRTALGFQSRL